MSHRVVQQWYERKTRSELGLRKLTDELIDHLVTTTDFPRPYLIQARELGFQYSSERGTLFMFGEPEGIFEPDPL